MINGFVQDVVFEPNKLQQIGRSNRCAVSAPLRKALCIEMPRVIREVTDDDIKDVVAIYNHYILNSVATFEEQEIDAEEMASRINKVKDYGLPWLVADIEGVVAGYAYAGKWNLRSAYRHTVEVTVYISSSIVSQGVGSELYTALFSMLRQRGLRILIGVIALPNPASVSLHEKFAMKKVGHLSNVGIKFGKWLDVGYWEVDLNA